MAGSMVEGRQAGMVLELGLTAYLLIHRKQQAAL